MSRTDIPDQEPYNGKFMALKILKLYSGKIINIIQVFSGRYMSPPLKKVNPSPSSDNFKQNLVKYWAKKHNIDFFIETGTFLGAMVEAVKNDFTEIYSIELDRYLYKSAKKRFKKYQHIKIIHGDSGEKLRELIGRFRQPCLFWLDAHYSGGLTAKTDKNTPIGGEIDAILKYFNVFCFILIDDARLFVGRDDYPSIDGLAKLLKACGRKHKLEIEDDIIRIHVFPNT